MGEHDVLQIRLIRVYHSSPQSYKSVREETEVQPCESFCECMTR